MSTRAQAITDMLETFNASGYGDALTDAAHALDSPTLSDLDSSPEVAASGHGVSDIEL